MMSSLTVNPDDVTNTWLVYDVDRIKELWGKNTKSNKTIIISTRQKVAADNNTLTNKVLLNKYILYLIVQYTV